ncbi:MAG TPA: PGPGW domain-containing protein [Kiritimatiellia bacterium]|nr:PGPGW domain-containing protein [Kiritimatiellia bacterium]HMP32790.1 PGPGW domain-containing protein [Kiritimatiellia bacterium]
MESFWQAHAGWIGWLTVISMVLFVATLVALPPVIARIPADYFVRRRRARLLRQGPKRWLGYLVLVGKNLAGGLLVLAGLAMLVLPGQGVVTILAGLLLLDFPGKFRLERRLVRQPAVMKALNWIRRQRGQLPLIPPPVRRSP